MRDGRATAGGHDSHSAPVSSARRLLTPSINSSMFDEAHAMPASMARLTSGRVWGAGNDCKRAAGVNDEAVRRWSGYISAPKSHRGRYRLTDTSASAVPRRVVRLAGTDRAG